MQCLDGRHGMHDVRPCLQFEVQAHLLVSLTDLLTSKAYRCVVLYDVKTLADCEVHEATH